MLTDVQTPSKVEILPPLTEEGAAVNVCVIYNAMEPTDRTIDQLVWGRDRTLADYLDGLPEDEDLDWLVTVNARPIKREEWERTRLEPEDWVVLLPVPHGGGGGGGGKGGGGMVLRMVAMIAVAVAAWYVAPYIAGSIVGTAPGTAAAFGSAGYSALGMGTAAGMSTAASIAVAVSGAVVSFAGNMLINAILPAPKPNMNAEFANMGGAAGYDSPSYGIDGAKNTSTEGIPVPVVYGTFATGGNCVGVYIENVNDSTEDTQDIYALYTLSEGPVAEIGDIEINDEPLSNYQNVAVEKRLGDDEQEVVGWFNETVTMQSIGTRLSDQYWNYFTTTQEVDKFKVFVTFPGGLCNISSTSGAKSTRSVGLNVQYRKQGTTEWIGLNDPATGTVTLTYNPLDDDSVTLNGTTFTFKTTPTTLYQVKIGVDAAATCLNLYDAIIASGDSKANEATLTVSNNQLKLSSYNLDYTLSESSTHSASSTRQIQWWGDSPPTGAYYDVRAGAWFINETTTYTAITLSASNLAGGELVASAASRNAVRRDFSSRLLEEAIYEIRVQRTSAESTSDTEIDRCLLTDIAEIKTEKLTYPFTALLGVKMRLGGQLSQIPKVTSIVKGRVVKVYDINGNVIEEKHSANPAWITIDAMTNTRYGGAFPLSRLDMPKMVEWARYCDEKGLTFNGVIDFAANLWDALQFVLRAGHAQIVPVGTRYTVVIERPETPVMMFSSANMIKDTFAVNWLPVTDRANDVEVAYYDKSDRYRKKMIRVVDYDRLANGTPLRQTSVDLLGIDSAERAQYEGKLALAQNRYILRTCTFEAPLEAIACTLGDLVYVQHEVPQWGFGGRLEAGSTATTLKLDRPVTMQSGKTYGVLVHQDAVKRYSLTVASVVGRSLLVPLPSQPAHFVRLKAGAEDYGVIDVISGSPNSEVILDRAPAFGAGAEIELWDTDVLEERRVILVEGEQDELTLVAPLDQAPKQFANWMFGEVGKFKKIFRIRGIDGSQDYKRQITAVDYDERVHSDPNLDMDAHNYSSLPLVVAPVENLSVADELYRQGTTVITRLRVNWLPGPNAIYDGADIYFAVNGAPFARVGRVENGVTTYISDAVTDGDTILVRVVAFASGARSVYANAPVVPHTVVGKLADPQPVTNFVVKKVTGGLEASWDANPEYDIAGYDIREGASWDAGVRVVEDYAGTRLRFSRNAGTYTYHIRAKDTGGRYSAVSTFTLQVPAPSAVRGFSVVQDGKDLVFSWARNPEVDISHYEVREGLDWEAMVPLFASDSNRHVLSVGRTGARTFGIKAVDNSGIPSATATIFSLDVAQLDGRNVVVERDEAAITYGHLRYNVTLDNGDLVLATNKPYGEYVFPVDLSGTVRARTVLDYRQSALAATNETTWAQTTFTWASVDAARPWRVFGATAGTAVTPEIAIHAGLAADELDGWSLSAMLTSYAGLTATNVVAVEYAPGRYGDGLVVYDTTKAVWDCTAGETFGLSFWFVPAAAAPSNALLKLSGPDGWLKVSVDAAAGEIELLDDAGNRLAIAVNLSEPLLIGIDQESAIRRLMVGGASLAPAVSSGAFMPRGSFTKIEVGQ